MQGNAELSASIKHPFILILAAGLLLRLVFIWGGFCDLYIVADDAYYYFTIARNITAGFGASFDTFTLTNGFHPLYLVFLAPLSALAGALPSQPWVLVHAALTFCAVADLFTGIALASFLSAIVSPRRAWWGVAAWMLGPWSVLLTLRGLESSIAVLVLMLWLLLVARHGAELLASKKYSCLLGVVYGLAFLARTDNLFFLGIALLAQLLVLRRRTGVSWQRVLASGGLIAGIALLVASPWFIWNVLQFGTPLQSSAVAKLENAKIFGTLVDPRYSGPAGFLKRVTAWIWVPARFVAGEEFRVSGFTWAVMGAGAAACMPALVRGWNKRKELGLAQESAGWGVGTYLLMHVVAYTLLMRTYATWYAAFPVLLFSMLTGITLGRDSSDTPRLRSRIIRPAALCLALGVFAHFFFVQGFEPRGASAGLEPGMRIIRETSPGKHVIGAYNAGALGYFAPSFGPYTVVNLDGLVNNRVREEWGKGRSAEYILSAVDVLWLTSYDELSIWLTPAEKAEILRRYRPAAADTNGQAMIRFRE